MFVLIAYNELMLIDEISITIKAGKGGDGLVENKKKKFIPKGGPWGGNGGDGGNVYIEVVEDMGALRRYRNQLVWKAEDGTPGGPNKRFGKYGDDLIIPVPRGTIATDKHTGEVMDFKKVGEKILIAKGGIGGRGNTEFKTSTLQAPRFAEKGTPGEAREFHLELQIIADIGLVGLPNAGKSSLLNELTSTSVKVANYPFTTLEPNLGVLDHLVLADIPGLIEGASSGKGLGTKFLRHIERTVVLAHCIASDSADPLKDYNVVRNELETFNPKLKEKKEIVVLTKTDLIDEKLLKKLVTMLKKVNKNVVPVSIHNLDQLTAFKKKMNTVVNQEA